jgi:glutamate-ammonia-ligase adenylyltransferase
VGLSKLELPSSGQPEARVAARRSSEPLLAALATVLGSGSHLFDDFLRLAPSHLLPVLEAVSSRESRPLPGPEGVGSVAERRRELVAWRDAEIFRIECEDLTRVEQPFGVFAEKLTELAEDVLRRAWQLALVEVAETLGYPVRETDGEPIRWAIASLGKFGGRELGFASDLELMVIFEQDGVTTGARATSAAEFFERAVQQLRLNIPARLDGIFALDLRLRPHGSRGPLASTLRSFESYYAPAGGAAPFERQALIRLRACAGDAELGTAVEGARDRFTYGPEPFPLDEALALRRRQIEELTAPGEQQLKLGPGGLVEIEYAVQYLQLQHGHATPAVRHPNTLVAIGALESHDLLATVDAENLRSAYILLRSVIDAMRLERGNARDLSLPAEDSREAEILARRLASEPAELFAQIEARTRAVATHFRARFRAGGDA